ncbi:MAG: DUF4295 domain-containing protein [Candidatus Cardinium sp.]|uniref:DUF4295 domain-containing protein n=1 Tax=Candidatus Cardinium hertigii TaxID=247481 RepID=A0A2Z3LIB2_9BACT|nr:DUF4295 family protein [Candidatus Cardinium hertigii]AWN81800.1 hypothetical protein DK880_00476 [Candidatus Cardinium hertigii]MDD9139558.1 DUF4295 domain-containing protein [Candidatus Cardinium sp.]
MAKKVMATLSKGNQGRLTKLIQVKRSSKTGAYGFRSRMVSPEMVKEVLARKTE